MTEQEKIKLGISLGIPIEQISSDLGIPLDVTRAMAGIPEEKYTKKTRRSDLVELLGKGLCDREIAAVIGASYFAVKNLRLRLGLPPNHVQTNKGTIARMYYQDNMTVKQIADQLGLTKINVYSTLHKIRRDMGEDNLNLNPWYRAQKSVCKVG